MVDGAVSARARIMLNIAALPQNRLTLMNTPAKNGQLPRCCHATPNKPTRPAVLTRDKRKYRTVGSTGRAIGAFGSLALFIHFQ